MKYEVYNVTTNRVILGGFLSEAAAKKFGFWSCMDCLWAVREQRR